MLLNAINYDPVTLTSKVTTSGLPMTAFDTTNLRLTFTAPPTARVLVRMRVALAGSSTVPGVFLGVMDGATVVMRTVPMLTGYVGSASTVIGVEAAFTVIGLTAGQVYTWDAAYGVENPVTSTSFRYGGPNDTVANNAAGAFHFEVWEA